MYNIYCTGSKIAFIRKKLRFEDVIHSMMETTCSLSIVYTIINIIVGSFSLLATI